ncbi:hypothetical protein ASD45_08645 [Pseudolabrys sp. Root1462]|nr:hypothetical protein ASD45_08645 [Pseudolabrys sp. Root1462]
MGMDSGDLRMQQPRDPCVDAYAAGYIAGLHGVDPRLCPFDKMTAEWRAWNDGQHRGVTVHDENSKSEKD